MDRNDRILIAVLRGWTLAEVGSVYGITRARVWKIVWTRVKRYITEGHARIIDGRSVKGLRLLRLMKNTIISRIERGTDG